MSEPADDDHAIPAGPAILVDHARWIIASHTARADGMQQRAMGFLGVIGATLGLVFTALAIGNAHRHMLVQTLAVLTVAALVAASIEFVRCLWLTKVTVPKASTAQEMFEGLASGAVTDARAAVLVANELLGTRSDLPSPMESALTDADTRAKRLKCGLVMLVVAFMLLAALIIAVVFEHGGG